MNQVLLKGFPSDNISNRKYRLLLIPNGKSTGGTGGCQPSQQIIHVPTGLKRSRLSGTYKDIFFFLTTLSPSHILSTIQQDFSCTEHTRIAYQSEDN